MSLAKALETPNPDEQLHRELHAYNRERLCPSNDQHDWQARLDRAYEAGVKECAWVERERSHVAPLLDAVPSDADAFISWFQALERVGPGQGDPLFPWLAQRASQKQLQWFLRQELAGEAGFDDLVALTQIKLEPRAKLELARNYWDEMGCGDASAMHGKMLVELEAELAPRTASDTVVWESLALANLMIAFASHRHLAYHSLGALGIVELTAPGRCAQVDAGLRRIGMNGHAREYYEVHSTIDLKHSASWNDEVLRPLVTKNPELARPLAEGALMRLFAGARCFDRYRAELGVGPPLRGAAAALVPPPEPS